MFLSLKSLYWSIPILLIIFGAFFFARKRRKNTISQLPGLKSNASPLRQKILTVSILTAVILAGIALLRPYGGSTISEHRKPAKNLVILLDVSKSMAAIDVEDLTRLEAAKLFINELIDKRPSDRIGLLSFSGATFPECPTTLDRTMLQQRLDALQPGSIPVGGTDFTTALAEANNLLTDKPPLGSAILIFSDGDHSANDLGDITKTIAKKKVPIFTFGFGSTTEAAPLPNSPLKSVADEQSLQEISLLTNGEFFQGKPSELESTIQKINSRIDAIELFGDDIAPEIFNRPLELYAYPLTAALILIMLHIFLPLRSNKWRPIVPMLLLAFILTPCALAQVDQEEQRALDEKLSGFTDALAQSEEENLPLILHFTGSDWSKLSITFEREILSHPVYQKWERAKAITRLIDLPRAGISDERRRAHRFLAKKFRVTSYPTSIFFEAGTQNILGRLTHDPAGPAAWIQRADDIIAGDETASDSPASVDYLPKSDQKNLHDKNLTPEQRSLGFYNKAIELERANPELAYTSDDRLKLLLDLYDKAAAAAPKSHPHLRFQAFHKQALLLHTKARKIVPDWKEDEMTPEQMSAMQKASGRGGIKQLLERAIKIYDEALAKYRQAAPLLPNHEALPTNLATAYRDHARAKNYLLFQKAYEKAVQTTSNALDYETRFRRSLDRDVTTSQEINRETIQQAMDHITELIAAAETIQDEPTMIEPDALSDFRLAKEDIILAPTPHGIRDLHPSALHIKNALEHLIDPQLLQQQQQMSGEGEDPEQPQGDQPDRGDQPEEEDPDRGKPEDLKKQEGGEDKKDYETDLRRAGKEQGDLRDRLLQRLERNGKYVPRSQDK